MAPTERSRIGSSVRAKLCRSGQVRSVSAKEIALAKLSNPTASNRLSSYSIALLFDLVEKLVVAVETVVRCF